MYISWTKSLATKLFLLMAISLTITVAGTVYQNSSMFRDFLGRQLEDKTVQSAKETANSIESILENWVSVTSVAMHNIPNKTTRGFTQFLNNFLEANPEFVSFQVITTKNNNQKTLVHAFTGRTKDIRFEDVDTSILKDQIEKENKKWIGSLLKKKKTRSKYLHNLNRRLKRPLTTIAIRYSVENNNSYNWAVVTMWQSRLMKAMPSSSNQKSYILGSWSKGKSRIDLSPLDQAGWSQLYKDNYTLSKASQIDSPFGFKAYKNRQGNEIIGAYHKIRNFGLTVAVSNDAKASYLAIRNIVLKSAIWALVYLIAFLGLSFLSSTKLTKSLKNLTLATKKIASGDFQIELEIKTNDEVGVLSSAVNDMSSQIKNLLVSKVEQARQEKELETAKLIQETLFPPGAAIATDNLQIWAKNSPASECGGDWWYHHTTPEGKEIIVIADATGHGASAALVTAMAFSGYQMLVDLYADQSSDFSPSEMLSKLNSVLYKAGNGSSTMTSLVCVLDPSNGQLTMANAGHNLPYIFPKSKTDIRLNNANKKKRKKRIMAVQASGSPMGLEAVWDGDETTIQIKPGDKLLLYTDGIFECANSAEEQWGPRRFRKNLDSNADADGSTVLSELFDEAFGFFDGTPPDDDITVVVAEISDKWSLNKNVA